MDKAKWYYENARTGDITDNIDATHWWTECGDYVNYWHWSDYSQEWQILMVREP